MTLTQLFTNIANAIRAKTGSSSTIIASNFPTEITNIELGYEKSEGENFNLKNSANAQLAKLNINGNSIQNGTPTPTNPVEIKSAGDNINLLENTYTTSGTQGGITHAKNTDGTMLLNGTATTTVFMILNTFNLVAGTYILSGCPNGGSENGYRQDILVGSSVITKDFGSGGSFTLNEDTSIQVRIRIGSGTVINNLTFKPMIAKGLIVRQYLPYGIRNINEVIQNKNSLNIPNNTVTASGLTATIENGIVSLGGTSTSTSFLFLIRNKLSLKAGTYTISAFNNNVSSDDTTDLRVTYRNGDGVIARACLNTTNASLTFTLNTDLEEGCLQIRSGSGNTFNNFVIKPQLELGSSATSFVPHQEQNISIPCQQPMRSIGNVRDSFVKIDGNWYERHYSTEIVAPSSKWQLESGGRFLITKSNLGISLKTPLTNDSILKNKCTHYIEETANRTWRKNQGFSIDGAGNINIYDTTYSSNNDLDGFQNFLSNNDVRIVALLENPTDLPCTEEQITALESIIRAYTYEPITNINSTDEVSPYLDLVYYKKI